MDVIDFIDKSETLKEVNKLYNQIKDKVKYLDTRTLLNDKLNESEKRKLSFEEHMQEKHNIFLSIVDIEQERLKVVIEKLKPIDEDLLKLKIKLINELSTIVEFKKAEKIVNDLFKFKNEPFAKNYNEGFKLINITSDSYLRTSPMIFFKHKWETYLKNIR